MKKTKIISLLIVAVMLVAVVLSIGLSSLAAEESTAVEDKGTIDVWLIGGQSNAVGYGDDAPAEAYDDARYFTGFDNTLFYGVHEQFWHNKDELQLVSLGHGQFPGRSGAEIGIAKAVDGTGKMNAVIKCAVGATSLYPYFGDSISNQVGTWTPPSYEERANMATTDANYATLGTYVALDGTTKDIPDIDLTNKITNGNTANNGNVKSGNMYRMFIKTVTDGVAKLRAEGYTPVIRGMWWMQGEAETYADYKAALYDELLTCLINDIREDVAAIVGDASVNDATSPMPFLAGNIIWLQSNLANAPTYIPTVNAAQAAVAAAMKNVGVLDDDVTLAQSFFGQQDNWHYNVATQQFFGEQLVKFVLEKKNQKLVAANGFGFTLTGGGTIANGTSATVTFTAKENYKINGVTLNGNAITLNNGSYPFTVTEDTVFDVDTSYTGTLPTTAYGTITDKYISAEDYPFALFKNGVFQQGYAAWITAMNSLPAGAASDEYVLLLRRDYTTKDYLDDSGALAINSIDSKLTLDLGGFNLTRSKNAYIFDTFHNNKNNTYTTDVTVKNGTITSPSDNPVIGLNYSTDSAGASARAFNFTFTEVKFVNTASSRAVPLITACWENGSSAVNAGIKANVTLNGCTVDFGSVTNGIVAGFTNDAKATNTVGTLTVNGGNIISASGDYSLAKTDKLDTVTVGAYNGSYPTVTLPTGVSPSTAVYQDANGENCGTVEGKGVTSGSNTVYTMAPDALVTPYGTITDSTFASTTTYPFAIFNANGFVTCVANFKEAVNKGVNNMVNKESIIYLRRDYDNQSGDPDSGIANINGTLKIDLGGYKLSSGAGTLLNVYISNNANYDTNIEVYGGGTLYSKDGWPIVAMDYNGSTSHTANNVKKFNMTFKDVTITSNSGGNAIAFTIWDNAKTVEYTTKCVFEYYNCTFDMTNANGNHVFRAGDRAKRTASIDVKINVYGGEFLNMGTSWMAWLDGGDSMNFGKYEGKYPTLTTAAGVDIKDVNSNFGAIGTGNSNDRTRIIKVSSDSTWNYYRIALQESTPYGYISAAYGDASVYPMAFFSYDGTSYTFLKAGTFGTIREFYSKTETKNIVAYLRANHTIDLNVDLAQFNGTLTVDLNGKILTRDSTHMFDIYNIGSNGVAGFASSAVIKNGTINSKNSFAIGIKSNGISGADKSISFTFEGVTFKYASSGATKDGAFFNCWDNDGADEFGTAVTVNFNNCIYDFTNAPAGAYMFSFTGNDATKETDVTAYFNGGKIIAPSISGWKLFNADLSQDSVHFGETALTAEIAVSGTQPTASNTITTSDNTYSYIGIETVNNYKVYNIEVFTAEDEETPYGNITDLTAETVSKADYPLAVFTPNGEAWKYENVYKTWAEAVEAAFAVPNSVVYLRTNLELSGATPSLVGRQVTFTVDLNGKSFTKVTSGYLFSNYLGAAKTEVNITIKNGSLVHGTNSSWQPFFNLDYSTAHTDHDANINYTFDNVTFENNRTTYQKYFIFCAFEAEAAYNTANIKAVNSHIVYNNCTFKANGAYIFDCTQDGNERDNIDMTVEVNGGKFIDDEIITPDKLIRINKAGDSVTFGKYEGSYPEFVYPKTMAYAVHGISFASGGTNYTLTVNRTEGDNVIYAFAPDISTTYGNIPAEYDVSVYPFALFKTDKTFIGGYGDWNSAINAAVLANSAGNFNLLMRRDTVQNANSSVGGFSGTINADLGGFRLKNEGGYMLDAWIGSNATEGTRGTYNIKNGYIDKYSSDALFCINYGSGLTANITHNLSFEGITFTLYNKARGLFVTWENGCQSGATANQIANCTFTDCTFDLANSADGAIPFVLTSGDTAKPNAAGTIFNVTINGGTIIADKAITFSDIVAKNDNENVVFGKNSAGKYPTLTLPSGAAAPTTDNTWSTAEGIECVFVKANDTTYALYPKVMVGYNIKTSVTLYSNFVYNIYIPKANANGFTVNESTVEYKEVEIDGVAHYHVQVNLPAGLALSDIALKVTLNSGSTTVDANWTLNVLKYTKSVINGSYNDTAKKLMKDMLVYAKAAHDYFGNALDSTKEDTVEALLEGYTKEMPTGEAKEPSDTSDTEYFKEVTVNLDKVPSFRFYLAGTYTADCFTAKVGDKDVELVTNSDDKGNYIEITMYAYMMLDDVKFTEKGTDVTVSYNLYAYYEFATDPNNTDSTAELVAIVEGLMKYSASSKAYRAAYIAANPNA